MHSCEVDKCGVIAHTADYKGPQNITIDIK